MNLILRADEAAALSRVQSEILVLKCKIQADLFITQKVDKAVRRSANEGKSQTRVTLESSDAEPLSLLEVANQVCNALARYGYHADHEFWGQGFSRRLTISWESADLAAAVEALKE